MSRWHGLLLLLLVSICLLALREYVLQPFGRVSVSIFDVGQGDASMIVTPSGKHILIDGGPDLSLLEHLGKTLPFLRRSIDILILTHPELDHIAAFPEVLRRLTIRKVLLTGVDHDLGQYDAFLDELKRQNIPLLVPDKTYDIDIGDGLSLDILWPSSDSHMRTMAMNNTSIVIRLLADNLPCILFTGDIEEKAERAIMRSGADLHATVLKVPHHGSKTSSSTGFLLAIHPSLAVISVGKDNRYGHPHPAVVDRYTHSGIPFKETSYDGTVSLYFFVKKRDGICTFVVH